MHVHHQDRFACLPWLGKGIQIGEIKARVSTRESKIGSGVMVRHRSFTPLPSSSAPGSGAKFGRENSLTLVSRLRAFPQLPSDRRVELGSDGGSMARALPAVDVEGLTGHEGG